MNSRPNFMRDVLIPKLNKNRAKANTNKEGNAVRDAVSNANVYAVKAGMVGFKLEYWPDQLTRMEAVLKDHRRLMTALRNKK